MRDVILVRTDLPKLLVSFSNPQSGNYALSRTIVLPTGTSYGDIVFTRGWTSIDIKLLGKPVARFVNTHLESAASGIRQLQALELVGAFGGGPLLTSMPAILVGDLNSDPGIAYNNNPASPVSDGAAYGIVAGAGFVGSGNTQKTFGHDSDLLDPPSADATQFTERIDHILTRPSSYGILSNWIVGRDPANRTPGGLWPSDHAGVIAGIG
jgi:endonuclease/exonuclease/phosphatase family metal-dependent hydrolase